MKYILFLSLLSFVAQAGPRVNNGGGAWVCDWNGDVEWIHAADFFESVDGKRLNIAAVPNASAREILEMVRLRIQNQYPSLDLLLKKYPTDLDKVIRLVPFALSQTDDMNLKSRPQPSECNGNAIQYEQVADYLYEHVLLIAQPVWENPKFFELDKAAILLHEMIYHALREDQGEQNSSRTRRLVALIFSDLPTEAVASQIKWQLSYGDPASDEEIATFQVIPRCDAYQNGRIVGSWQPSGQTFGETGVFNFDGVKYSVFTSSLDGVPERLLIEDSINKSSAVLEAPYARASYMRLKKNSLNIRMGRKELQLLCWNQR